MADVGPIDPEIVDQMAQFGIDCAQLPVAIALNEHTNETAVYRQLKRSRWTDMMKGLLEEMRKLDGVRAVRPVVSSRTPEKVAPKLSDRIRVVTRTAGDRSGFLVRSRVHSEPPSVDRGLDGIAPKRMSTRPLAMRPPVPTPLAG
jgi:hypothetical protein